MSDWLPSIFTEGWTPGAIGIWSLLGAVLLGWWKGLPGLLDALGRREARIEEMLSAQASRFNEQLRAADDRHEECMEGQRQLREQMRIRDEYYAKQISEFREENTELWGQIRQMRQGARSVEDTVTRAIKEARSGS